MYYLSENVKFPDGFIAFKKYPGYFYRKDTNQIYSIKIDGILKPLKTKKADRYHLAKFSGINLGDEFVTISCQGKSKIIFLHSVEKKLNYNYVIPIHNPF